MRILSAQDVAAALAMDQAVELVGRALAEFSQGHTDVPERIHVSIPERSATTLAMPALAGRLGALGIKLVSVFPQNPRAGKPTITGIYNLLDAATGEPIAIIEASSLTALRTGAVAGLGTKLLAREDARTAAIIGTGVQALAALRAMLSVRQLTEVRLYNRTPAKAEAFAAMARQLPEAAGVRITVASAADYAVRGADVVLTATTSDTPVFSGDAVAPGMHINAIGAFRPTMREVPAEAVVRAAKVVVESRSAALAEAGDLLIPMSEGRFRAEQIYAEIGEIYAGNRKGREHRDEITLFKSVGHAVMDVVTAKAIYDQAVIRGLGKEVDLGG